jgi:hypothetical protein
MRRPTINRAHERSDGIRCGWEIDPPDVALWFEGEPVAQSNWKPTTQTMEGSMRRNDETKNQSTRWTRVLAAMIVGSVLTAFGAPTLEGAFFDIPDGDIAALKAAFAAAGSNTEGDYINLAENGTYVFTEVDHENRGPNALPTIEADWGDLVFIDGNGSTFERPQDSTEEFRFVNISSGASVWIDDLTFQNGFMPLSTWTEGGGALRSAGPTTLTNCRFFDNATAAYGGAVFLDPSSSTALLKISDCTLSSNHADSGRGGAVAITRGEVQVSESDLSSNTAATGGGAIYTHNGGAFTATNTSFQFNESPWGGALMNFNGDLTFSGCMFRFNRSESGRGGAVWIGTSSSISVENSTFLANFSQLGGSLTVEGETIVAINHATFHQNLGGATGAAIHFGDEVDATLHNTLTYWNFNNDIRDGDVRGPLNPDSSSNLISVASAAMSGVTDGVNGNIVGTVAEPVDAGLGLLAPRDGPMWSKTPALDPASPAVDGGNPVFSLDTDQRGQPRPSGSAPDIGAFELQQPLTIVTVSGDGQTAPVDTAFPTPLKVQVLENGTPLSALYVRLTSPSSGASALFSNGEHSWLTGPDASGQISLPVSANSVAGSYEVIAEFVLGGIQTSFSLTNTPNFPSVLEIASGDNQSSPVGEQYPLPLRARVTDNLGNPIAGVPVQFIVPTSGPSVTFGGPAGGITDATGVSSLPAIIANHIPGDFQVQAVADGIPGAITFSLSNLDITSPVVGVAFVSVESQLLALADCDTYNARPRGLVVGFSEAMADPEGDTAGNDLTNPANYWFVTPGPDHSFETVDCSSPAGDDVVAHPVSVGTDENANVAELNLAEPLTDGMYRFIVCGSSLTDRFDNALDGRGDGSPGSAYVRGFRVDSSNLFTNGQLDCGLTEWTVRSTNMNELVFDDTQDSQSSAQSGSAHVAPIAAVPEASLGQCIEVAADDHLQLTMRILVDSGECDAAFDVELFDQPGCVGTIVDTAALETAVSDSTAPWSPVRHVTQVPEGTQSAMVWAGVRATDNTFSAWFDDIEATVAGPPLLFADDFETGELSQWSGFSP